MPDAENSASVPSAAAAPRRTVTVVPVASAICDANVRCQIRRYSERSWLFSSDANCCGERSGVVGRIASWASWAFFTFEAYCFGCGDRYCGPYSEATAPRTACIASSDSVTLSVRM